MAVVLSDTAALLADGVDRAWHSSAQLSTVTVDGARQDLAVGQTRLGEPMDDTVLVPWFCAAKALLVLALAQFVDSGQIRWDDPVSRFFAGFDVPGKRDITLRHVLTHAAGFRRDPVELFGLDWHTAIRTIARTRLEPGWAPGVQHSYLPFTSWYLIGEVAQRLAGRPLGEVLRENVLAPLGLAGSHVGMTPTEHRRLRPRFAPVVNHQLPNMPVDRLMPIDGPDVCCASGPLATRGPVRDLVRLYAAVGLGPAPPLGLDERTWAELIRRPDGAVFDHRHRIPAVLGLGFVFEARQHAESARVFGPHCSADTLGHRGLGSVVAYADRRAGIAVAAFFDATNQALHNRARIDQICDAVYRDLDLV